MSGSMHRRAPLGIAPNFAVFGEPEGDELCEWMDVWEVAGSLAEHRVGGKARHDEDGNPVITGDNGNGSSMDPMVVPWYYSYSSS